SIRENAADFSPVSHPLSHDRPTKPMLPDSAVMSSASSVMATRTSIKVKPRARLCASRVLVTSNPSDEQGFEHHSAAAARGGHGHFVEAGFRAWRGRRIGLYRPAPGH